MAFGKMLVVYDVIAAMYQLMWNVSLNMAISALAIHSPRIERNRQVKCILVNWSHYANCVFYIGFKKI